MSDWYEAPDEAAFMSMEYVEGANLGTLLARQPGGYFTWDYLGPVVRQLCEALDYAHNEKVIHRDLKPSNMLRDDRQRLRLADFGIAAWAIESPVVPTGQRHTSGTLPYMSPQQIEGQPPQVTDDIYALGATLYEFLSGHPPFYQNDIAYQVRNVLATPLDERLADLEIENEVPPAVAALIMACLAKDPEKRPQSARAVADWIGFSDAAGVPATAFVPRIVNEPPVAAPIRESKKTAAPPAPVEESEPVPPEENPVRRGLVMFLGSAALGVLAWFAWSHFIPKMPAFPAAPEIADANSTNLPSTNSVSAAPPVQPVAAAVTGTNVSVLLGSVNQEKGLREVGGEGEALTSPATIGGQECRLLRFKGKRARGDFAIAPPYKRPTVMNVRVQVEYYATSPGVLQILFDGSSRQMPHFSNGGKVSFDAGNAWRIADFQLNDAVFHNGQADGADFRLVTSCHQFYIHGITVFFDE
jgi:hypothetical protein